MTSQVLDEITDPFPNINDYTACQELLGSDLLCFFVAIYWAPFQYPKIRLIVRSCEVSKPRDLYLKLSNRSEI